MTDNPYLSPAIPDSQKQSILLSEADEFSGVGLRGVLIGLRIYYCGMYALIGSMAFAMILMFGFIAYAAQQWNNALDDSQASQSPEVGFALFGGGMLLVTGMYLLFGLATFVGQCCCISVPSASRARGPAIYTIASQVVYFFASIGLPILMATLETGPYQVADGPLSIAPLFFLLILFSSLIAFILFLIRTAKYTENARSERIGSTALRLYVVIFILGAPGLFAANFVATGPANTLSGGASFVIFLLVVCVSLFAIAAWVTFMISVHTLASGIKRLRRQATQTPAKPGLHGAATSSHPGPPSQFA